jgi:glycosidase
MSTFPKAIRSPDTNDEVIAMMPSRRASTVLKSEFSDLRVEVDPTTGSPRRLWCANTPNDAIDLDCSLTIVDGGEERRGPVGGLIYEGTDEVTIADGGLGPLLSTISHTTRTFRLAATTSRPDDWELSWIYAFRSAVPRLAITVELRAVSADAIARNVRLDLTVHLDDRERWRVQSPGNRLRPDVPLAEVTRPVGVSPAGGLAGSAGLIAFERTDRCRTLVVWPLSKTEIGDVILRPAEAGAAIEWTTDVGGMPGALGTLLCAALHLDLVDGPFASLLETIPECLASLGITSPDAPPAWAVSANLYEVQVGFSIFAGGDRYAPYPEAQDLLDDLDRIEGLGYNALQIMPRHPFPSYNVFDYSDITTSYGEESVIRRIVDACHARGMHVILDILMHGVVDGEAITQAVDGVRSGPYADRLDTPMRNILELDRLDPEEREFDAIAWAAHLRNFEAFWVAGSPMHHPLVDAHPDWFCRDSAGRITGRYTKAFDLAHPDWQRWFIDHALALVERLGIDGFRFDAPIYDYFHNWSERTRTNAAVSMLGCLSLFEQLRMELRAANPEALLYTEPSGVLLRQSMDVTYNYDETWLVRAVMTGGAGRDQGVRNGYELGRWFADRDASLPRGSLTAHHIDSHDTFWWPDPGQKWRREVYGLPATAALMTLFALSGGPYMTFVGGEIGIEPQVRAVAALRSSRPEFTQGVSVYDAVTVSDPDIYAVVRQSPARSSLLLVNLSDREIATQCALARDPASTSDASRMVADRLRGRVIDWSRQTGTWEAGIVMAPYETLVFTVDDLLRDP